MGSSDDDSEKALKELQTIRENINKKTDESLESTRRMVDLVTASEEAGINTMVMLDEQGEKLDHVEKHVHNIDAEMDEAQKNLNQLQKCCGLCVLPWKRFHYSRGKPMNSVKIHNSDKSTPVTAEPEYHASTKAQTPKSGYINRITNDDREVEMDNNMDVVSNHLGTLKNIAVDMGHTLSNQNIQIQRITEKTETQIGRLDDANKQARYILKND